ncbi:hypothetical protein NJC38_02590 [Pseudomonas sp. 21LCFQ010]|uniref:hypothetical protein n=1 Tax=Pseudomonas sp. 21LCFQ010 TaxID=2957506 RepID=UPI0020979B08|nr:hypothetical protein [Pseudomonas sp. 21LCFQ010]MCO8161038.1 hypothetical protein [Pseudomonas sp. 21LCFQ010]
MTRYQRARRIGIWRGAAITVLLSALWILASSYAGQITYLPKVDPMNTSPQELARQDWATIGAFDPEQLQGDQRREYEAEAARIERQWDNQPN